MVGPLVLAGILAGGVPTSSAGAHAVDLDVELVPVVQDYELPGHPSLVGRTGVGVVGRLRGWWHPMPELSIALGAVGRLPFAARLEDEVLVRPIVTVEARPFGEGVTLRLGSLDFRHGYHPAIVDEARLEYGRDTEESYNATIPVEAARSLGGDPYPPAEHGVQLVVARESLRLEAFLDWQLLETAGHREKFAFGTLGRWESDYVDLGLQLRVVHYGGQRFTKSDPIRNAQLDPVRQPETLGASIELHPLRLGPLALHVPAAFVAGHARQERGGAERWHFGTELGVELELFDALRLGYRAWLPRSGMPGTVSEDGDPIYREGRAHRARIALRQVFGDLEIDGRLDLVVADAAPEKLQYLAVTILRYRFVARIFSGA